MIAHKVVNDKWPEEYYKMVARANKEIMDVKTTDCWGLVYKWCIDSKQNIPKVVRDAQKWKAQQYITELRRSNKPFFYLRPNDLQKLLSLER